MTRAAIIGGGVIGGGWAARFLLNGWNVAVFDPDPETPRKVAAVLDNARAALPALSDVPMPPEGALIFADSIAEAVAAADHVQECVGENLDLKHRVLAEVQRARPDVAIGSSTSGFRPSVLQQGMAAPQNILVAHPFVPVYLLPLVEVVPSPQNEPAFVNRVMEMLQSVGMYPLHVRKEIDAHIADRFLESVWREALWLVKDGIATTEEIDESIRMGFGLRWGQMGLFETYRMGGGEAGMKHFLAQFGPCLDWPWSRLTDVPELTDDLVDLIAGQSDAQSGHMSIRELERARDANLVGFLRALKDRDWGAGKVLRAHDARLAAAMPIPALPPAGQPEPLELARMHVLPGWIDYNGHMTESRYLFAASETVDAFLRVIGADVGYVKTGFSYYTAETHILHHAEARAGDALTGTVQILGADEKRAHVFVRLLKNGQAVATIEQMLLHVDMAASRTVPAPQAILDRLMPLALAHQALLRPDTAGRYVGERRG